MVHEDKVTWKDLYHRALLELDRGRLAERVLAADQAIQSRLQELSRGVPASADERRTIHDALQNLRVLRRELAVPEPANPMPAVSVSEWDHSHAEMKGEYLVAVNRERRYTSVTTAVCQLLGYSREELLNKTIDDITAPDLRPATPTLFQRYLEEGEMEGEYVVLARDGSRVPVRYQSRILPDGCMVARWEPLRDETSPTILPATG